MKVKDDWGRKTARKRYQLGGTIEDRGRRLPVIKPEQKLPLSDTSDLTLSGRYQPPDRFIEKPDFGVSIGLKKRF